MRVWQIISNTLGELAVNGPKIPPNQHIKVVDVRSLIEIMEICDRHLIANNDEKVFTDSIRRLREESGISEDAV